MIVERNENERLFELAQPKRAQVMVITRTEKRERPESRFEFAIEIFDDPRRRAETKLRAPLARVECRQLRGNISPRVVEIEMKCAAQKLFRPA